MPDAAPSRRHRKRPDPATLPWPERATFVELGLVSCFSFLRGASQAEELAEAARDLGYDAIGIADANSMAGVGRPRA